jgi:pregnancy-associated plasma protein-A
MISTRVSFFAFAVSALLVANSLAAAAEADHSQPILAQRLSTDARGRVCATPEPTAEERAKQASLLRAFAGQTPPRVGGTIQVAFHVIHDGDQGNLSDTQIEAQIREINRNFLGTGYRFSLASIDRTDNSRWFKVLPGTGDEKHMKAALAIDPAHRLNVYTASLGHGLVGWAYFPTSFPEDYYLHGVVIHYGSLPGGFFVPYDLGRTLTHEIGHYLGLFHTFQGGCVEPGDMVDDTPAEATPNYECPEGRNTCPAPGDDPIHNYMDYSTDACYSEFTSGQDARMDMIVPAYRPSLLDAPLGFAPNAEPTGAELPAVPRMLAFRGGWPNPFQSETVLRFSLPASAHVQLRVYDVAGHLVANVVDAAMPAGDHSAPFRAGSLPAGMYFASLRVNGTTFTRSLMRIP